MGGEYRIFNSIGSLSIQSYIRKSFLSSVPPSFARYNVLITTKCNQNHINGVHRDMLTFLIGGCFHYLIKIIMTIYYYLDH